MKAAEAGATSRPAQLQAGAEGYRLGGKTILDWAMDQCEADAGWLPTLPSGQGPLHTTLLSAIRRDVDSGRLRPGQRLPPQRDLARSLGISVGTVTRALSEGIRSGVLRATVGRGTFVRDVAAGRIATSGPIDLAQNISNIPSAGRRIAEAMRSLGNIDDVAASLIYFPPVGSEPQRRAAAAWLRDTAGLEADWHRLVITSGAQAALSLALGTLCTAGDALLVESSTYPGVKPLAVSLGLSLIGVDMDEEGLDPAALDKAAAKSAARVLYTVPTLQNPTARTMRMARRREIVEVAQKHKLSIVEDDLYAAIARSSAWSLGPLASLAPERTFYISSVSKVLAPGLRTGMLLLPSIEAAATITDRIKAGTLTSTSIGTIVFDRLVQSGAAVSMLEELRRDCTTRVSLAVEILGGLVERPTTAASLHIWLPLAAPDAEMLASRALAKGVALTPPQATAVAEPRGIRLCIGAPATLAELREALETVRGATGPGAAATTALV